MNREKSDVLGALQIDMEKLIQCQKGSNRRCQILLKSWNNPRQADLQS